MSYYGKYISGGKGKKIVHLVMDMPTTTTVVPFLLEQLAYINRPFQERQLSFDLILQVYLTIYWTFHSSIDNDVLFTGYGFHTHITSIDDSCIRSNYFGSYAHWLPPRPMIPYAW